MAKEKKKEIESLVTHWDQVFLGPFGETQIYHIKSLHDFV